MCAMGLKWNMTGDMITALRRRLPPVLYHVKHPTAIAEFNHPGYSNVCTMKSNCFAGNKDQVSKIYTRLALGYPHFWCFVPCEFMLFTSSVREAAMLPQPLTFAFTFAAVW